MAHHLPHAVRGPHSMKSLRRYLPKLLLCSLIWSAAVFAAGPSPVQAQSDLPSLAASRGYYFRDLFQPQNYVPGKNSFLFQTIHKGQRKTVLELAGSGSVRHLWSTWSIPGSDDVPTGRVLLRVFVDGQSTPAIIGTIDELCRAAERTGARYVPLPVFIYKDAYNFYLPIYFSQGIKIEIEALDEINEFYTQIDYRLTPNHVESERLVSARDASELVLTYRGEPSVDPANKRRTEPQLQHKSTDLQCGESTGTCELSIHGPGILRELSFRGDISSGLQFEIYWDGEAAPSVRAPLKYFFSDFANAAVESKPNEMTCYFPMPFRRKARIVFHNVHRSARITVGYALERTPVSHQALYFHAAFNEVEKAPGYSQYPALRIKGRGVFVGLNIFDTGHNHGGGDAALIDTGTDHPHVLHGICGEDYFGFAWHHTGTMSPLTGAPVHERRYRLHLENPYPFTESFQFLFGVFAGQHPKSVAFWYQQPTAQKQEQDQWIGVDAQWKTLGPLGPETTPPDDVTDQSYDTNVAINIPTAITERWQNAQMMSGALDLTYQFRHYVLIEKGSGFVPGASRTRLTTYIYSSTKGTVDAVLGHDDEALVRLNEVDLTNLSGQAGFGPSHVRLSLRPGWNRLDLTLTNDENVNWRWSGLSLALRRDQSLSQQLKFASEPKPSTTKSVISAEHN